MSHRALATGLWAATAVIALGPPARAEPPFAIGLDYTVARGGAFGAWNLGWRLEAGPMFRLGRWQATASASALLTIGSDRPERDSDELTAWGVGGRLAYHLRVDRRGSLFAALGVERLWFTGSGVVRRDCRQTRACLAGYYHETPAYDAWAPQLRVGIGPYLDHPEVMMGATFEVIVEALRVRDVPPDGVAGVAAYGAFTFSFGFGPKRRAQNL